MWKSKVLIVDNTAFSEKDNGLFVTPSTGNLVVDLLKQNYKVELLQFRKIPKGIDLIHFYPISNLNLKITSVRHSSRYKLLSYAKITFMSIPCLLRNDFIYFFYPSSLRYLALLSLIFKKKIGFNIRGERKISDGISIFLYKRAKLIFTVSPHFTELAKKYCAQTFNKRPTIDYSIDDMVTKRDFVNRRSYRLLFLSRLDLDKGILDLLDAMKILNDRNTFNIELLIVGDGDAIVDIKNKISENALNNVILYGAETSKNKIKSLYVESDLYILPSYHEGFPRTLYEAMIFKTPILTTFVGGIGCIMNSGYNCYKIEPHNPMDIADKIEFVFSNYSDMKIITDNASKTYLEYIEKLPYSHGEHLGRLLSDVIL